MYRKKENTKQFKTKCRNIFENINKPINKPKVGSTDKQLNEFADKNQGLVKYLFVY